jgi:hypothetical protein
MENIGVGFQCYENPDWNMRCQSMRSLKEFAEGALAFLSVFGFIYLRLKTRERRQATGIFLNEATYAPYLTRARPDQVLKAELRYHHV